MTHHTEPFAPPKADEQITCGTCHGITNRIQAVLIHVPFYSIEGNARLAKDASLSASTVSRVIRGKVCPTHTVVKAITEAISWRFRSPIEERELFSTDGTYPTASTCELMRCRGCFPPEAWHEGSDMLRPPWERRLPGEWSICPQVDHKKAGGERPPASKTLSSRHFIFG